MKRNGGLFMKRYYNNSWKEVVEALQSDIFKGLSNEECLSRRKSYGNNKIDLPESNKTFKVLIRASLSLYLVALLAISIYLIISKEYLLGSAVLITYIFNLSLKLFYTNRKESQIGELQKLNYSTVVVLRDGVEKIVKSEELVKGDIVFYKKGSLIAADMRIIRANDVLVDETNITGERFLKEKFESKIDGNISTVGEMKNILFKGTVVKEGEGSGIVIETGNSTEFGKLLALLTYANNNKHTLGKKIEKLLSRVIIVLISIIIVSYFILSKFGQASNILNLSLFSVGIFPVGIFLLNYIRILKKNLNNDGIELINLSTFDLINSLDILFLDKVGAITKERMEVRKLYTNNEIILDKDTNYNKDINTKRLLDILLLCNNSIYNASDDTGKGDLLEIAYLRFAANKLAYKSALDAKHRRVFEVPIDSDKRFLTTLNKSKKGYRINVKGNLDAVLDRCTHIMIDGIEKEIEQEDIEKIKAIDYNFSVEGLTTQGIAYRSFSYEPTSSENIESNLVFVGIIALENLLNEGIEEEINYIKNRGSVPIIFTEDNKIAATTIGRKIGLIKNDNQVISGVEVSSLNREELIEVLKIVRVFSRVTPEVKGKIIGLFTRDNYNVLSSGETLSDLTSLSLSKVGIGKGKMPDIVKKICDVYIKENYLKGLFKLFDLSKNYEERIKVSFNTFLASYISQIASINLMILFSNSEMKYLVSLILINLIYIFYTITRILMVDIKKVENKKYIIRSVGLNLILVIIYFIGELLP